MLKKIILPGRPKEAHHSSARTSYEVLSNKIRITNHILKVNLTAIRGEVKNKANINMHDSNGSIRC